MFILSLESILKYKYLTNILFHNSDDIQDELDSYNFNYNFNLDNLDYSRIGQPSCLNWIIIQTS